MTIKYIYVQEEVHQRQCIDRGGFLIEHVKIQSGVEWTARSAWWHQEELLPCVACCSMRASRTAGSSCRGLFSPSAIPSGPSDSPSSTSGKKISENRNK